MTFDGHAADHGIKFPRPSSSIFAYCKRSKTGGVEGLVMRLGAAAMHKSICDECSITHSLLHFSANISYPAEYFVINLLARLCAKEFDVLFWLLYSLILCNSVIKIRFIS